MATLVGGKIDLVAKLAARKISSARESDDLLEGFWGTGSISAGREGQMQGEIGFLSCWVQMSNL